jgi:hypothetical protein
MTDAAARTPVVSEPEYLEIAAACQSLLTSPDAGVERIAIPWLHVIREHPIFLANYAGVAQPAREGRTDRLRRRAKERAGLLWQLAAASADSGQPWAGPRTFDRPVDVLFVSHLLNRSQAGAANDFYFGAVPADLAAAGHPTAVALINHTRKPAAGLIARWSPAPVPRVVLAGSLGVRREAGLHRRMRAESRRLRALAARMAPGLPRRVAERSAEEARSMAARRTLRMADQVGALVSALRPRVLVVTHEGHAWERIAFSAARQAQPAIVCAGYQHSAIFRAQFAIRQRLADRYNPDCILTAGPLGRDQLRHASGLQDIRVAVLGSDRAPRAADRDRDAARETAGAPRGCLVMPEGLVGECDLLFEFSLACARALPETPFVWRLHPSVTFPALMARNPKLKSLPPNIRLSTASLDDDFMACRWTLYRGTTAVVQAVGAGLLPIYLRVPGEMTIDPLYEAGSWRATVETPSDFTRAVRTSASDTGWRDALAEARAFCARVFVPFEARVLTELMSR